MSGRPTQDQVAEHHDAEPCRGGHDGNEQHEVGPTLHQPHPDVRETHPPLEQEHHGYHQPRCCVVVVVQELGASQARACRGGRLRSIGLPAPLHSAARARRSGVAGTHELRTQAGRRPVAASFRHNARISLRFLRTSAERPAANPPTHTLCFAKHFS